MDSSASNPRANGLASPDHGPERPDRAVAGGRTVWILNHYAVGPDSAGGTRHHSLGRHLARHGWSAIVLAAGIEYNTGRRRLAPGEPARLDDVDGVPFLWVPVRPYEGNGVARVRNILDYTRAVLSPRTTSDLPRPDAVIGSSVHPMAAWAGRRLAARFDVPFLFEVRDLWPQTLVDMGRLSTRHPATFAMRRLETTLYRSADRIVTLLPEAHRYIAGRGIDTAKVDWISNGVEIGETPPTPPARERFDLMYFGAHGGANGLDNVLRAMGVVGRDPRGAGIALRLIGDGPTKPRLVALARELGLSNVTFEAPVPKDHIPALAGQADAFVFNLIDAPVFQYGISSNKLFDFMAAGRPVIFCCSSANNPVADAKGGVTVAPERPEDLAAAILDLAHRPVAERAAMGAAARRHVEAHYSYPALAQKLARSLDTAVGAR